MNRTALQSAIGLTLLAAIFPLEPANADDAPVLAAAGRHLLFDDQLIDPDHTRKIETTLTKPYAIERVFRPEQPWEALGFIFYSTVIDHKGTAMLYYGCYDAEKGKHLCLATSKNGQDWTRPSLGLTEFEGSTDNNLFPFEAVEAGVFLDPSAPPEKQFRLLHNCYWPDPAAAGVYLSSSSDGINWIQNETRLFPRVPDSQPSAFFDPKDSRYHIYQRAWTSERKRAISHVKVRDLEKPWPFDETVEPLHIWGTDRVATPSNELPIVMSPDALDAENVHLYTSGAIRYPWASDAYFAFPAAYFHFKGQALEARALDANDGTFDVQIAVSRDGVEWERFREPWVEPDYRDGVALQLVSMTTGMIRRGREIHQFFVGWPYTHNRPVEWDRDPERRAEWIAKDLGGIYRATTRVDGFVARAAGNEEGILTTRELEFEMATRLRLNIDTSGIGYASVAIVGEDGRPLPGYAHKDCELIHADEVDFQVRWQNEDLIPAGIYRIEVEMRSARIWAIEFTF
ncbi:MAG: hypothetical protein AAF585_09875 [Verrucomicrobiota bacterium]